MEHTVITVGREYGSGGRLIAQSLARELGFSFYDKELIGLAAQESGLSPEFIEEAEQKKTSSFLYNLSFSSQNLPINDQVFIAQSNVIRRVAGEGSCVIVGRCADYVLRDHPGVIRIFIHAPIEDRLRRAAVEYHVPADNMKVIVQKTDKNRASYYNHFTGGMWGNCQNYDLAINSSLGLNRVTELLARLVTSKEAK